MGPAQRELPGPRPPPNAEVMTMGEHTPEQSRLERLRRSWEQFTVEEQRRKAKIQDDCPHDAGTSTFATIVANGSRQVFTGCALCQKPLVAGRWVKHTEADLERIVVTEDRRGQHPPCAVCGEWGTELHHWAPRAIFGSEADHWPTSYLCVECHTEWHKRIGAA